MCTECGKMFPAENDLKRHMLAHDPQIQCEHCAKKFPIMANLKKHILAMHTDEKDLPYKCEFCGKGFSLKFKHQQHVNTHTKAFPYQCRFCLKRFNASSNRRDHEVKTHGDSRKF